MQFFRSLVLMLFACAYCHAELVTLSINNAGPNASLVEVFVDAGLLGDDEVTSSISGEITLDLLPSAINPLTAQVVNFDATVDDEIDFRVGGGFFLPTVTVEADPASINLSLIEPGLPGDVSAGMFSQFENLVAFQGVVTASVEPEPIDLGELAPTLVDLEDVSIALDRSSAMLSGGLITEQTIPFEVGPFEVNVVLEVDGLLQATGSIPSAVYSLSTTETATSFSESPNWLRGAVADTNSTPTAIDSIVIDGLVDDPGAIDLNGARQVVTDANFAGRVELQNGTLDVTGSLVVEEGAIVFLHPETELASNTMSLNADSLLVLQPDRTHTVEGELAFESGAQLSVLAPTEPGTFDLINFGSLLSDYDGVPLTHVGDGRFRLIEVDANTIRLVDTQAIVGDADGNGQVEFADFLQLSSSFGTAGDWIAGDFDGNGVVEFADFLGLSANFGQSVEAATSIATIPEPSGTTLALLCFLILSGLRGRRSLLPRRIS